MEWRLVAISLGCAIAAGVVACGEAETATSRSWALDGEKDGEDSCADFDLGSELPVFTTGTVEGATDDFDSCTGFGDPQPPDLAYEWTAPRDGTFVVASSRSVVLQGLAGCEGPELFCATPGEPAIPPVTGLVELRAGESIVVVVEGTGGDPTFDLAIFERPASETLCDNFLDDDADGLPDCDDPDCAEACGLCP